MKYLEKHPIIMIIIGIIGISVSSIFVRFSTAPATVTAFFRLFISTALLTPVLFLNKENRNELFKVSKKTALLSILSGTFLALHFTFMFMALKETSIASTTSIIATEVIWVSLGYMLFLKGKLQKKAIAIILFTFLGSLVIALGDSGDSASLFGDGLALLAAISVAVYMLLGRVVRKTTTTNVYTYLVYLSGAAVLLISSLGFGYSPINFGLSPIIVGLLLAVFSTLLGHSIFSWCLKFYTPSFVSTCKLLEPVVASIIAIPLFLEFPKITTVIGGAMILIGVYYYTKIETKN